LEIVEGPEAGRQVQLDGLLEVGREEGAGLRLSDEQVSRSHARLSPAGDHAIVEDAGSANGTYVNDQAVSGKQEVRRGDEIRFGLTVMLVRSEEEVRRSPSAIGPSPRMTVIADDVLMPVPREQLSSPDIDVSNLPSLLVEESEPAFVPRAVAETDGSGGGSGDPQYGALASLVDSRVKHRTTVAAMAFLSIAGLVVLIYFGAR
jgi:pSer/pThr/pTyr-binding forkhead associated (FHA) protein